MGGFEIQVLSEIFLSIEVLSLGGRVQEEVVVMAEGVMCEGVMCEGVMCEGVMCEGVMGEVS